MSTETPVAAAPETPAAATPETTQPAGDATATAETTAAATTETADAAAETDTTPADETQDATAGPPDAYALTVPVEGAMSAEGLKAFEAEMRDLGATNEIAQTVLGRRFEAYLAQADRDLAATKSDPVYGGTNLPNTQKHYKAGLDRFAPEGTPHGDGLRALLRESGRGDALPIVAFFTEIGKAMAEDRLPATGQGQPAAPTKSLADRMYEKVADGVTQA